MSTRLHDILASVGSAGADIPAGWAQGRATFGGLVAALMQTHLEQTVAAGRPLRSAAISFVGPAASGPISLRSELIRSGKSALQAECRALQGDQVVAILLAGFGQARESRIGVAAPAAPTFKSVADSPRLPWLPGVTPEFTQHFEFAWSHGDLPFTGGSKGDIGGWVRLRESAGLATGAALLMALVDAWPPAPVPLFQGPAPASTMTWTLDLPPLAPLAQPGDWWQYEARTVTAAEGYAVTRASLWTSDGTLAAVSQQHVAIFQ